MTRVFAILLIFCVVTSSKVQAQIDTVSKQNDSIPSFLTKKYLHKDRNLLISRDPEVRNPFSFDNPTSRFETQGYSGLNRSGSISRGITVGNNQNLSVQSGFNLQLSGRLTDDIDVVAAISDDNIPIQPEGNTQQIQEFDRIYIKLYNDSYALTAGDFELRKPNSYFLNYFKKAKGAYAQSQLKINDKLSTTNNVAIAVAKGKYNRMVFFGTEGVQGPYRLTGLNNEQFILVLAGTERVFIDGQLMKRGENADYIIDYNTAEISFTPRKVITAYSRITIEFEYSEKSYSRTLTTVNSEWNTQKWNLRLNYYNEQDSKNRPLIQDLTDSQKLFLSTTGDQIQDAYYPSADSVGFNSNEIRYKKVDSSGNIIYIYSTNKDDAFYRLNFTEVGKNKGNYVIDKNLANGRVFKWVSPVNGVLQGNYEPIILLVAPRKTIMMTLAFDQKLKKGFNYSIENSISQVDNNLFSKIDDNDNTGFATKIIAEHSMNLNTDTINNWKFTNAAQVELISNNFRFVEFYRPVEFNRDFNLYQNTNSAEQWFSYQTGIRYNEQKVLSYKFSGFLKDTIYRGLQHSLNSDFENKKYKWTAAASLLNTELNNNKGESFFLKHRADLTRKFKKLQVGLSEETEYNTILNKPADTLERLSFSFSDYRVYVQSPTESINTFRIEYSNRLDRSPYLNELRALSRSQNIYFSNEWNRYENNLLSYSINYRHFDVLQKNSLLPEENNILGRVRYDARWFDGFISSNTFYEIGTGQEPKRAYTYVQVPTGQGVYVHRDYNNNGIKELNEFEVAKFSYEADYIRVNVVSTDFIRTKSTAFSENIILDPNRILNKKNSFNNVLSKFSDQITLKIERKIQSGTTDNIFNPFDLDINDTALVSIATQFRNTFFLQRSNPIFGAEYNVQGNGNKSALNIGFESRDQFEQSIRSRWNFLSMYSFNSEIKVGNKKTNNDIALGRNYVLEYYGISPEFAVQYTSTLRLSLTYTYYFIENTQSMLEQSKQNKLLADVRYQAGGKSSIQFKAALINNQFKGTNNTAIAYEMLDGLQPGTNYTWGFNWQRTINNNFQLSFIYDGRASENAKTIHAGSMQARAYF